jgi:peroxiredoxin
MTGMNKKPPHVIVMVLLILLLAGGCKRSTNPGREEAFIGASLPAWSNTRVYLEELNVMDVTRIDSVVADGKGEFHFMLKLQDAGFYILRAPGHDPVTLLIEKGEKVELDPAETDPGAGYAVRGSPGSELLRQLDSFTARQKLRVDSLARAFDEGRDRKDFFSIRLALDSIYETLMEKQSDFTRDFIRRNSSSLASLIALNRKFGRTRLFDELEDSSLFFMVDSALMVKYPGNKHALDHHQRIENIRKNLEEEKELERILAPGNPAPEIILEDTTGAGFTLSSLRGGYVVLYFWAGTDAKSRQENASAADLFSRYAGGEVQFCCVSFDMVRKIWKGAIRLDRLPGIHVSDLKGSASPVMKLYHLKENLPQWYLLDRKGLILSRGTKTSELAVALSVNLK